MLKTFDMKDLGSVKRILGMEILRERKARKLWLSQERYIERMLENFNIKNSKLVHTTEKEKGEMSVIPYSSVVGSLMYTDKGESY